MNLGFIKTKVFLTITTMVFSAMLVGNAFAQTGTSRISGTVTDQTGAAVPGATVTIDNPATGFKRTTTTDNGGGYSFPGIPPATYDIAVEAGNFRKVIRKGIKALVDSPIEINVGLEPGDVSAVVDVTGADIESIVNTQDASIGNNFVAQQISELPSSLGRVENLITLQPNVTPGGSVAGARSNQTNYTLDGVDINDAEGGTLSAGLALRISTGSVEEFRITTTNANANQGRSSGAQASLVTKSGTNQFRGSAFYYRRTTEFSANTFHGNKAGNERPKLDRDVYGGTIGGPIIRDRAFFFYSLERQNDQKEAIFNTLVPKPHVGNGEIRFPGTGPTCTAGQCVLTTANLTSIFPNTGVNPAVVALFKDVTTKFPSNNNDIGDGVNTGGYRFNSPTSTKENSHVAKFDFNLSDRHTLSVRGNYQWDNLVTGSHLPNTAPTGFWEHPTALAATHSWTISNNKINTFRYGLTRQSYSSVGDLSGPSITFRAVFSPTSGARTSSRVSAIHSFYDDFTWIKGNHTMQFGGTMRLIRNKRSSLAGTFDSAVTNTSWNAGTGNPDIVAIQNAGYTINTDSNTILHPMIALFGRLSQYTHNYVFDKDGTVQSPGTPITRKFATEEYEFYGMDTWKLTRNLTLTLGLRYSLGIPVYEQNGFQAIPQTSLGAFFEKRKATAAHGVPTNEIVNFILGGKVNNAPGFYEMDTNNWQPRVAIAWSPNFKSGFLRTLLGEEGDSTFRGGFSITNDNFAQWLATTFDGITHIGFSANATVPFGSFNNQTNPGPLYTGQDMNIRALGGIQALTLDLGAQSSGYQGIKEGLDSSLTTPIHYVWNASYGRSLPGGMHVQATYTGRKARDLFAYADVAQWNNIVDPLSGVDWYTAGTMLYNLRRANTPVASVAAIPFFENLFPALGVRYGMSATQAAYRFFAREFVNNNPALGSLGGWDWQDWTWVQNRRYERDGIVPKMFGHAQYDALHAYGSYAKSDYHAFSLTLRQRLGNTLTFDINYTLSKSMDDASGDGRGNGGLILNPLLPDINYKYSNFDAKHLVNANFIFQLPVGKGKTFFGDMNAWTDALVGGWQLAGIYRYNSGFPYGGPSEYPRWATNWQFTSDGVLTRPVKFDVDRNTGQAFADPTYAFQSYRASAPGEIGTLNNFRALGNQTLDLTLSKYFTMPWSEDHKLQFKWDVFNVTNNQPLAISSSFGRYEIPIDPDLSTPGPNWGVIFNTTQGTPRRMQFGLRYEF